MRKSNGLTLIEVLIALAILSIALTAIIKATSQNVRDTLYLQNKTLATWVGTEVVNAVRAGAIHLPEAPASTEKDTVMLNQTWTWKAALNPTPNPHIQEIDVTVFTKPQHNQTAHVMGYLRE